ncbi:GxxExxY protein, partial [Patescibacteria group bacterium]
VFGPIDIMGRVDLTVAVVFHDYLAAIMTVIWLIVFWWFSFSFVLEDKGADNADKELMSADGSSTDRRLIKVFQRKSKKSRKKVSNFLYEDLTYKIRGAMFAVHNRLGSGHKEVVYQKALAKEFKGQGIPFEKEKSLKVKYKNEKVGVYKPDFIVDGKVIIEMKAVPFLSKKDESQLSYYLKGTPYNLGLLVNFGSKKLDIRRRIWTK